MGEWLRRLFRPDDKHQEDEGSVDEQDRGTVAPEEETPDQAAVSQRQGTQSSTYSAPAPASPPGGEATAVLGDEGDAAPVPGLAAVGRAHGDEAVPVPPPAEPPPANGPNHAAEAGATALPPPGSGGDVPVATGEAGDGAVPGGDGETVPPLPPVEMAPSEPSAGELSVEEPAEQGMAPGDETAEELVAEDAAEPAVGEDVAEEIVPAEPGDAAPLDTAPEAGAPGAETPEQAAESPTEAAAALPLARGTVVGDRYTLVSEAQPGETPGEVRYLATDALAYQQCWSCGSRENSAGMRFCQSCGAGLQDHPVVLAETAEPTGQRGEFAAPTARGYMHMVQQRRRFGAEGIALQVGAYSAEGPHHPNEDTYWYTAGTSCGNSLREAQGVIILADGMGGYHPGSGLISKKAAVSTGEALWASLAPYRLPDAAVPDDAEMEALVRQAVAAGNATVLEAIRQAGYDMGCTLVVAVVQGDTAYVANIGDSRAYYLSPTGAAEQITEDQSQVGALVRAGHLAPEAVYTAAGNNLILHAIGEGGVETMAGWSVQPLEPTSTLLLCSDGYWKTVRGAGGAAAAIGQAPSLDEAARTLVTDALDRGSDDNTTVVIVRVV